MRPVLAIIGASSPGPRALTVAEDLGREAVEAGFRIACGGLGGVMEAACRGAHSAPRYREGDTMGFLPSYDRTAANSWVDIAIPTGLLYARNTLVVASAHVVVAVGGGAGTLSEVALAWQLQRPIVALDVGEGWSTRLADQSLDTRRDDRIHRAESARDAVTLAQRLVASDSLGADAPRTPR